MRAILIALTVFAALAGLVLTGAVQPLDDRLALAAGHLRAASPAWAIESGRDVTALGSNAVLGLFVLGGGALALLARRSGLAIWLLIDFAGGLLLVGLVKAVAERPRPEVGGHAARVFTSSFPSSHATLSAALYGFVALWLMRWAATAGRGPVLVVGLALPALVGLSRVYLGLHWPSDVMAGWSLGFAWGWFCHAGYVRSAAGSVAKRAAG